MTTETRKRREYTEDFKRDAVAGYRVGISQWFGVFSRPDGRPIRLSAVTRNHRLLAGGVFIVQEPLAFSVGGSQAQRLCIPSTELFEAFLLV